VCLLSPRVDQVENLICWQDSTEVQAFMKQQNIPNVTALRDFYETTVQQVRPRILWRGGEGRSLLLLRHDGGGASNGAGGVHQ
jgi:hypothetical protein